MFIDIVRMIYNLYVSLLKHIFMKAKLTLSIDEDKVKKIKQYAKHKETSISNIVEEHFEKLVSKKSKEKLDITKIVGAFGKEPKDFDWKKVKLEYLMKKYVK